MSTILYSVLIAGICQLPYTPPAPVIPPPIKVIMVGQASWYDYDLKGLIWSKNHRTAASRDFPRGTTLEITNTDNGKTVEVLVNDYGPTLETGREIDLSSYAFSQLAPLGKGVINVEVYENE
jgi:rare lipoprotein A